MRPAHLPQGRVLPPVESLADRLQAVEARIQALEAQDPATLPENERRGRAAHLAALGRRRRWYLTRLRAQRPVETLDVAVSDLVHTADRT